MQPNGPSRIERFLQPGEYAVEDARHYLRTLLGSCVSIVLWHPQARVGAMSHFLLPCRGRTTLSSQALDGRYGDESLELMLNALQRRKLAGSQCVVRVFGGGNMFPGQTHRAGSGDVGRRNGEAARAMLQSRGMAVRSESLFGIGHRRIEFDVATGDVWSQQIAMTEAPRSSTALPLQSTPGVL